MTQDAIIAIMRSYSVCPHYKATAEDSHRRRRYAVFKKTGQVSEQVAEPSSHGHAQRTREQLVAADILALVQWEVGHS